MSTSNPQSLLTSLSASLLRLIPSTYLHSWLLYLGIVTHVRNTIEAELKPLHGLCEYLNALHIYADEARQGHARPVEAFHFCSHVSKDLRQCLIYDSNATNARLIGVEYMIPRAKYESLPEHEQRLWHSHEFEVRSGMLVMPRPAAQDASEWERLESEAMKEVVGLYGKTFHFWEIDNKEQEGFGVPMGLPRLMGSLTESKQLDVDEALRDRNERFDVNHKEKKLVREQCGIDALCGNVSTNADSWWKEAAKERKGVYKDGKSEAYETGEGR